MKNESINEIFTKTTRNSMTRLKRMIDLLLEASGSTKTSEDLFDIHLVASVEVDDWNYEEVEGEDSRWEDLTDQEKLEWCLSHVSYDSLRLYPEVEIVPKSPDIPEELIELLKASIDRGLTLIDAKFR